MKDNEELRKLIESNPDLPLVFIVATENITCDYTNQVFQKSNCYVSDVYFYEEFYTDDKVDMEEHIRNMFDNNPLSYGMNDEIFDALVADYMEKEVESYKAIVVSVY